MQRRPKPMLSLNMHVRNEFNGLYEIRRASLATNCREIYSRLTEILVCPRAFAKSEIMWVTSSEHQFNYIYRVQLPLFKGWFSIGGDVPLHMWEQLCRIGLAKYKKSIINERESYFRTWNVNLGFRQPKMFIPP